jgi:arylsulfatase A-like enzyme
MSLDLNRTRDCLAWGALAGAATWSAYAVVEFAFTSLVFRATRPYAVFTGWHWQLTAMLVLGYLVAGPVAGAAAGLVVHLLRNTSLGENQPYRALETAAVLALVATWVLNLVFGAGDPVGLGLIVVGAAFALLLVICLASPAWMDRVGFLTNYWVAAGLLLALGQEDSMVRNGVGMQIGARIGVWSLVLAGAIGVAVVAAVAAGRWLQPKLAGSRWGLPGVGVASVAAAIALMAASQGLAVPGATAEAAPSTVGGDGRPNVVLIVMDTVRADHLSLYGYQRDTTPQLRALAQEAVVYNNSISAADLTLTSHASLFTGMYPSWHGAYCQPPEATYGRELAKEYPTVAELLKKAGYETLGVAANLYLRADFGLERGFDVFRIPRPVPMLPDESRYLLRRLVRHGLSYGFDTAQFDRLYSRGEDIDLGAFDTLEHRSRPGDPFFLFLNYMDAHFPYVPPAPFSASFPGRQSRTTQDDLLAEQYLIANGTAQPPEYRPHCVSQYDGGIAYEDAQIGRVANWLKRHNAWDNTLFIVTSDHGEAFGERNRVGHANSPYQNLLHVPLLVKYPRGARSGREQRLASLTDVAPTILSAAGAAVPASMQGRNLMAIDSSPPREIFGETFPCPVIRPAECLSGCSAKAVYSWPLKFISMSNGKRELFNLAEDPDEKRNLYVLEMPRALDLGGDLKAWMKDMPAQERQSKQVDPEKLKQLKGLGYVQ